MPFGTRAPYDREVAYARLAARTPHYIVSTTLDGVSWPPTARIVRSLGELRTLKDQTGGTVYVVGGATLVTSLLNDGLLDELRLIVHPVLLGGGRALFAGVAGRRSLTLVQTEATKAGRVILTYRM